MRPDDCSRAFAAEPLDWPAVRELLRPLAPSELGRRALQELLPRTSHEAEQALERAREMQSLSAEAEPPLAGGSDPLPGLRLAQKYRRTLDGEELVGVARLLRLVEDLGFWMAGRRAHLPTCAALWAGLPDLAPLRTLLDQRLDRRGAVVDDATPALARLRAAMAELTRELDLVLRDLAHRSDLRTAFADGHVGQVHVRGGRRVLAVRQRHAGQVPGIVHDRSQSGETIYVEPREVVERQNRLAECEADAAREVNRILTELTRFVLDKREAIELYAERLGELELAVLSARFGRQCQGRPARLPGAEGAPDQGMLLRAWRHPLLLAEQDKGALEAVTPIDLRLGGDFDLLVVTGPNTGGKTLALKGAGLAALMTNLGFALPCSEGTCVPLYAGIVADIGDEQEIQQNLSTFSSHLKRIREGLERADGNTLVLLDELGGGTDPTEGAALGEAILEELSLRGVPTIASTHLGQLKEFAFRFERAENAHVEFDLETLAPRYTLVIGAPGESRALAIARRLGFPPEIVDRADGRLVKTDGDTERLMTEMRDVKVDAERLRGEAEQRLVELEQRETELASDRERVRLREGQVEAEAQRGLEERVDRARTWLERARALLPQIPSARRKEVAEVLDGLAEALGDALLTERRQAFLDRLKKGEFVWLPKFKKRCQVTRVYKARRELDVKLGKHELTVGFDDVTFYESL